MAQTHMVEGEIQLLVAVLASLCVLWHARTYTTKPGQGVSDLKVSAKCPKCPPIFQY